MIRSIQAAAPPAPANTLIARSSGSRAITAIARNAFREAVRDRVLYNLVLFVFLLIGGAIFLGELSAGQEAKIIVDLSLSAMLLFGVRRSQNPDPDIKRPYQRVWARWQLC